MTAKQMRELLWTLKQVRYKDWFFSLEGSYQELTLRAGFYASCVHTGKREMQWGRKWPLPQEVTPSQLVATAFKAVITAEEHEVRETFTYRDCPIFGPHFEIENLVAVCQIEESKRKFDEVFKTDKDAPASL